MLKFKEGTIHLGEVREKKKVTLNFVITEGDLSDIHSVGASCGCSTPYISGKDGAIVVEFTPQEIPKHLSLLVQDVTKYITVFMKDNSKIILSFTAKVVKS